MQEAQRGSVKEMALLGQMYLEGYGVKPDTRAAKEWIDKASAKGYRMQVRARLHAVAVCCICHFAQVLHGKAPSCVPCMICRACTVSCEVNPRAPELWPASVLTCQLFARVLLHPALFGMHACMDCVLWLHRFS